MDQPLYFAKIKYVGSRTGDNKYFVLLLDLAQKELSYQIIEQRREGSATIEYVIASYAKELSTGWINQILPLCNVRNYEPCRSDPQYAQKEWGENEGCIGYRDGISIRFYGIIASDIPKMELGMDFLYDEQHEPPQEKLYQFLIRNFLLKEKELKQYIFR